LLTRGSFLILINQFLFYFLKVDQGWLEISGRSGVIKFNQSFSNKIGLFRFMNLKFIFIFILSILFVLLF